MGSGVTQTKLNMAKEDHEKEQAQIDMWKYVCGFVEMGVVKCAIELGIADAIENNGSPMTLPQLSSTLNCEPSYLSRIMRFLVYRGIFKQEATLYSHTPLSRLLITRAENSMASLILLESSPVMLAPWHKLSARVQAPNASIDAPFETTHGEDVWRYAAENPDHSRLINEAMACDTRIVVPIILEGCKGLFEGVESLVDVGGGNGTTMGLLVRACPWIRGINFDAPHVVSVAGEWNGVEHVGGDMFCSVPKADAVFLKWVLHDWDDEDCIKILKNCKEAIPEGKGKVILVEAVIEEGDKSQLSDTGLKLDMIMMAHTNNGKERTRQEWAFVLHQAGFTRFTITPIPAIQSVIQAFP